jgi:hypothetical protein
VSKTLYQLRQEVLTRLGDTALSIWTEAEIESYIKRGYELLCLETLCLWRQEQLIDVASQATYDLPDDFLQMDRVTNDHKRLIPTYAVELERNDNLYRTTEGTVEAYCLDSDGPNKIRLWRVPATAAESAQMAATGTWGLLRTPTDIDTSTFTGTWGMARIYLAGEIITGTWGILRGATTVSDSGTVIEFFYRPETVALGDTFSLPDRMMKYVRHYAMHRAFAREGSGQDTKLAKHYFERYMAGIMIVKNRQQSYLKQRNIQLGGVDPITHRPPKPKLPWNYGHQ